MVLPPAGTMRIIRTGCADAARIAEAVCASGWADQARVLKREERGTVFAATIGARAVVVKCHALGRLKDHASVMAGRTRLLRQWRGTERLERAGVPSTNMLVLARGGVQPRIEVLVMERVAGRSLLHHIADGGATADLADVLGEQVRSIAGAGLVNRDHKASNLIVAPDGRVVLIDTVGVRAESSQVTARRHMLFCLIVEMVGTKTVTTAGQRMRVVRAANGGDRKAAREDYRAVAQKLVEHGDPTPKHDPFLSNEE
jgi:tRNA A-37 threonylcarbamoyl transferase component Bud32